MADDLAVAVKIHGDDLLGAPVGEPQSAVVPAGRLDISETLQEHSGVTSTWQHVSHFAGCHVIGHVLVCWIARRIRWHSLCDACVIGRLDVEVNVEPEAVGMERLGGVHVDDGIRYKLELHTRGTARLSRRSPPRGEVEVMPG